MFFLCRFFWGMASCVQITLQHQSVSGFSMCLFQVGRAYFSPQISGCSHLLLRLTALKIEARYVQNHKHRWTDWRGSCTLLFPHYRVYKVTLHRCNDWDVWNFKSHGASSGHLRTAIMCSNVCLKQNCSLSETIYFWGVTISTAEVAGNDTKTRADGDWHIKCHWNELPLPGRKCEEELTQNMWGRWERQFCCQVIEKTSWAWKIRRLAHKNIKITPLYSEVHVRAVKNRVRMNEN